MIVTLKNIAPKGPKRVRVGTPVADLEVGPICPFHIVKDDIVEGVFTLHYGLEKKLKVLDKSSIISSHFCYSLLGTIHLPSRTKEGLSFFIHS